MISSYGVLTMKNFALPLLLVAVLPGCTAAPPVDVKQIGQAIEDKRFQAARDGLLELREFEGSSRETSILLAKVWIDLGDGYTAERYLSEFRDPSNTDWAIQYVRALILQGRSLRAGDFLEEFAGVPPQDGTFDWLKVWIAMEEGQVEKAEELVDRALVSHPRSAPLHAKAARLCVWRNNWEAARRHADEALENDPDNYEAQLILGESQIAQGDQEAALATYQRVSAQYPDYAIPRANKAGLLLDLGRLDEAQAELNSALQSHPQFALLLFNLARLQTLQGNSGQAQGTMQSISSKWKRSFPAARLLEAEIEAALGNHSIARTIYAQIGDDPRLAEQVAELAAALPDKK